VPDDSLTFAVSHDDKAVELTFGAPLGLKLTLPAQLAAQLAKALYEHALLVHQAQQQPAADPAGPN
jgi:hypothetical protein